VKAPQSLNDQFNAREALQNPSRLGAAGKLGQQQVVNQARASRFRRKKFGPRPHKSKGQQAIRRAQAGLEALHPLCSNRSGNPAAAHSGAVQALEDHRHCEA
jgi:hypothetical protein